MVGAPSGVGPRGCLSYCRGSAATQVWWWRHKQNFFLVVWRLALGCATWVVEELEIATDALFLFFWLADWVRV